MYCNVLFVQFRDFNLHCQKSTHVDLKGVCMLPEFVDIVIFRIKVVKGGRVLGFPKMFGRKQNVYRKANCYCVINNHNRVSRSRL